MEKVLIDMFIVPSEAKSEFREAGNRAQQFIRTLPGFVEGFIYELTEGNTPCNFMTTAVWASGEALENAKRAVLAENQRQGYDPQETLKRLNITKTRATYDRAPY